mmetsp:Transcript_11305/g.25993  ORF Transcript_11305/g.25993 Transcript_11305/m.25993 type:complete len:391 (-) Transcript_11305:110-1282(-)
MDLGTASAAAASTPSATSRSAFQASQGTKGSKRLQQVLGHIVPTLLSQSKHSACTQDPLSRSLRPRSVQSMAQSRQPRVVLLTGASKGYGRAVAIALSADADSTRRTTELLLVARDSAGLEQTAKALYGCAARCPYKCLTMDLSSADSVLQSLGELVDLLDAALKRVSRQQPAGSNAASRGPELIIIHNAGSLGQLGYCQDIRGEEVKSSMDLNVTTYMLLNNAIMERFGGGTARSAEEDDQPPRMVRETSSGHFHGIRSQDMEEATKEQRCSRITFVNVSSLLAVEAFPSWSLYAVGKAARDMAMRVIAKEAEVQDRNIKSINWAPGPMRTEMTDQILKTCPDEGVLATFQQMDAEDKFVQTHDSAEKLVRLLNEDTYQSGAHIDYFDV